MTSLNIDYGFTTTFLKPWSNKCKYQPSKIGGRPAFLALAPVLGPTELTCGHCGKILRFILQVYAPLEPYDEAFHRTLFVFACGRSKECADQFRVFRSQLGHKNRFYSADPPAYDSETEDEHYNPTPEQFGVQLCPVCGVAAPHRCAKCQKASYCSKEHQIVHWKLGGHKDVCGVEGATVSATTEVKFSDHVFPELELVIGSGDERLSDFDTDSEEDTADVTESEMSKYQEYLRKNKPSLQNENMEAYSGAVSDSAGEGPQFDEQDQLVFENFKKQAIAREVVRYRTDWFKEPTAKNDILWISSKNQRTGEQIPKCEQCGAERRFEFQVMPQLLNELLAKADKDQAKAYADDQLDWGTLLVFSCSKSCPPTEETPYVAEFIYNQPA